VAGPFTNARQLSSHSTNTSRPRPRSLALHPSHIAHFLAASHCTSPHRDSRLTLSLYLISLPALLRRARITAQFAHHARSTSVLRNTRPPASLQPKLYRRPGKLGPCRRQWLNPSRRRSVRAQTHTSPFAATRATSFRPRRASRANTSAKLATATASYTTTPRPKRTRTPP
jgi:hypothetical protein